MASNHYRAIDAFNFSPLLSDAVGLKESGPAALPGSKELPVSSSLLGS